jgi:hypothetical protein
MKSDDEQAQAYRYATRVRRGLLLTMRPFVFFGVYLVALCMLDIVFWKAFFIAAGVFILLVNQIAIRLFERSAIVLVIVGSLVWIEALPAPTALKQEIRTFWNASVSSLQR